MAKKKKGTVRVKRYVTVTKTVVKKQSDPKTASKQKASPYVAKFAGVEFHVRVKEDGELDILTWDDVTEEANSKWADHEIIGYKHPRPEFLGCEARTMTITVVADATFGQNPHSLRKTFIDFCNKGKVSALYIGSRRISSGKWKIDTVSDSLDTIWKDGILTKVTFNLTLSTYY